MNNSIEGNNINSKNPLVSVSVITYQHSKYIRDCLDGILMQNTDFPFEVLIHDDASTDGTEEIVKEYASKYSNIIKPLYEKENQWQKGRRGSVVFNFPRAKGKYIALCEGDDYWTDPLKLQKQVEFMEENEDCSLCFHATKQIFEKTPGKNFIHRPKVIPNDNKFTIKAIILGGGGFMATNSMFFSRQYIQELPEWLINAPVGDGPLLLLLATKGKIGYIDKVMAAYRKSTDGSWSDNMKNFNKQKIHHYSILKMWDDFDKWSGRTYHKYVIIKKNKNIYSYRKKRLKSFVKSLIGIG